MSSPCWAWEPSILGSVEGRWHLGRNGQRAYAAQQCGVEPVDLMLVAVHPWDIDGANRAGLGTAWINRTGATYPDYFTAPTLEATSVHHPPNF